LILVDTSVWIDFFAGADTPEVRKLESVLSEEEDVATCGVILTEVLQGIRKDADYRRTRSRFDAFLYLPMNRETFVKAAELYRSCRRKGLSVRKPIDCMIAAVAVEHGVPLLHADRDFDAIGRNSDLRVVEAR
jgi:hypothetical protein